MSSSIRTIATAVAATLAIAAAPSAQAQDENWSFEVAPYLWGAGLDTDITIGDRTASVERDFSDIVEALDIGGGIMAGARVGHFVAVTQIDYLALDTDELDDVPTRGRLETDVLMAMLAIGYRFERSRVGAHTDLLVGARQLSLDNKLTLDGLGSVERDKDFAPFFDNLCHLVKPLLPRYREEGKSYLTIAIGCTGGRHRSVFTAEKLAGFLSGLGYKVGVRHRDLKEN